MSIQKRQIHQKGNKMTKKEIEVACSIKKKSFDAGKEIGKKLSAIKPENVFLFASVKHDFKKLIKGILSETKTTIIGCSTAGEIYNDKVFEESAVALGFNSPNIKIGSGLGICNNSPKKAGAESLRNSLENLKSKNLTNIFARYYAAIINDPTKLMFKLPSFSLMTFIDGLASAEAVLRGIQQDFRIPIPLIGGSAGDDLKLKKTLQICNNKVYTDSVVTTSLFTNKKLCFGVRHGWIPRKRAAFVTKAKGRIVYELNNRPALEVYAELLDVNKDKLLAEKNIAFKTGLQHPFAIISIAGDCWLKHPQAVFEDGSISFFSEVPEGAALVVTDGTSDSLINAGIEAAKEAIKPLRKVEAIFVFNCVARKAFLGKKAEDEIKQIAKLVNAPIIGFYSYGEQAFSPTTPVCHRNQTIAIMAIGE